MAEKKKTEKKRTSRPARAPAARIPLPPTPSPLSIAAMDQPLPTGYPYPAPSAGVLADVGAAVGRGMSAPIGRRAGEETDRRPPGGMSDVMPAIPANPLAFLYDQVTRPWPQGTPLPTPPTANIPPVSPSATIPPASPSPPATGDTQVVTGPDGLVYERPASMEFGSDEAHALAIQKLTEAGAYDRPRSTPQGGGWLTLPENSGFPQVNWGNTAPPRPAVAGGPTRRSMLDRAAKASGTPGSMPMANLARRIMGAMSPEDAALDDTRPLDRGGPDLTLPPLPSPPPPSDDPAALARSTRGGYGGPQPTTAAQAAGMAGLSQTIRAVTDDMRRRNENPSLLEVHRQLQREREIAPNLRPRLPEWPLAEPLPEYQPTPEMVAATAERGGAAGVQAERAIQDQLNAAWEQRKARDAAGQERLRMAWSRFSAGQPDPVWQQGARPHKPGAPSPETYAPTLHDFAEYNRQLLDNPITDQTQYYAWQGSPGEVASAEEVAAQNAGIKERRAARRERDAGRQEMVAARAMGLHPQLGPTLARIRNGEEMTANDYALLGQQDPRQMAESQRMGVLASYLGGLQGQPVDQRVLDKLLALGSNAHESTAPAPAIPPAGQEVLKTAKTPEEAYRMSLAQGLTEDQAKATVDGGFGPGKYDRLKRGLGRSWPEYSVSQDFRNEWGPVTSLLSPGSALPLYAPPLLGLLPDGP